MTQSNSNPSPRAQSNAQPHPESDHDDDSLIFFPPDTWRLSGCRMVESPKSWRCFGQAHDARLERQLTAQSSGVGAGAAAAAVQRYHARQGAQIQGVGWLRPRAGPRAADPWRWCPDISIVTSLQSYFSPGCCGVLLAPSTRMKDFGSCDCQWHLYCDCAIRQRTLSCSFKL